ncbi:hypothetical protein [Salisediminibacterium beveridgei]|uniref:hypothetical protein n=1 Tax=Salisediminibacterium beveridgei TaxID=632773 RepID=UPI0018DDC351|nr:hypothetical protein [Salisediminibacterium beveridgei]
MLHVYITLFLTVTGLIVGFLFTLFDYRMALTVFTGGILFLLIGISIQLQTLINQNKQS